MKKRLKIPPFAEGSGLINVVIETPKGNRNKYAYDEGTGLVTLKKVLPCGMVFPFDFGCVPGTQGDDGDPLDVLVLMENPVCTLCLVQAHLIGVIEAEQSEKGKTERNDRLIAVANFENEPAEDGSVKKLDRQTLKELERFFVSYNALEGKQFKVLNYRGPKRAVELVKNGINRRCRRK